jgi:hypothetical protein
MTAVAVFIVPAVLLALFGSNAHASSKVRHEAGTRHRAARVDTRLMSYAEAQKVAKLANFYNAVTANQEATFLQELTYLREVSFLQALATQQAEKAAAERAAAVRAQTVATPAPAPVPAPASPSSGSDATSTDTADWACIRSHESGGNYSEGGGGAYQFTLGTWQGLTGLSTPAQDSAPAVQDAAALKLFSERGWQPWTTRYVCGL